MELAILCAGKGTRLGELTNGKPKQMLEIGRKRIYDYHLEISEYLGVEPVIISRPEYEPYFNELKTRIEITTKIDGVIPTLYRFRDIFSENFCWIAGDMIFTELSPLKNLLEEHLEKNNFTSFFYAKNPKFKAKFVPSDNPRIVIGREGNFKYAIPNFLVHSNRVFEYMEKGIMDNFLQRGIESGERVCFHKYESPVFEIDTPEDLNEAKKRYED